MRALLGLPHGHENTTYPPYTLFASAQGAARPDLLLEDSSKESVRVKVWTPSSGVAKVSESCAILDCCCEVLITQVSIYQQLCCRVAATYSVMLKVFGAVRVVLQTQGTCCQVILLHRDVIR